MFEQEEEKRMREKDHILYLDNNNSPSLYYWSYEHTLKSTKHNRRELLSRAAYEAAIVEKRRSWRASVSCFRWGRQ